MKYSERCLWEYTALFSYNLPVVWKIRFFSLNIFLEDSILGFKHNFFIKGPQSFIQLADGSTNYKSDIRRRCLAVLMH